MAKLKAPLFSFGASGKLGDSLVFFPWKGLHVVRSHVVPANPNTADQQTQRGYITDINTLIHALQAQAVRPLDADDIIAYRALASTFPTPRTWFNAAVKEAVDAWVRGDDPFISKDGTTTPAANALGVDVIVSALTGAPVTAGDFWYGNTPTSMINSQVAVVAASIATANLAGLTTGQKTYWHFIPTAPAGQTDSRGGIYHGTPT